jgi:hypothetical protein
MNFRIGQKVVCIEEPQWPAFSYSDFPYTEFPRMGGMYTIRWIGPGKDETPCVLLREITNPDRGSGEPTFYARRFRPAVERRTDISIFTKMLTDA